jgi:hypothetical protein
MQDGRRSLFLSEFGEAEYSGQDGDLALIVMAGSCC